MAPRISTGIREIVYQLSPYQQDVIGQAFKNAPRTFMHFMKEKGPGLFLAFATYYTGTTWTKNEMHNEKLAARF